MRQPFWSLPICSEPPAAPNIPPRQPEKPFARAVRFSGCFILQAACTFKLKGNHDRHRAVYLSDHLDSADQIRPDNPRAEKWGAFWGFMLAMGWVFVYWTVEAVIVRIYAAEMCKQAGITVYVAPEQWRSLTKESADNLRKNAPFSFKKMFLFPLKKIVSYSMDTSFNFLILLHCRMIYIYIYFYFKRGKLYISALSNIF